MSKEVRGFLGICGTFFEFSEFSEFRVFFNFWLLVAGLVDFVAEIAVFGTYFLKILLEEFFIFIYGIFEIALFWRVSAKVGFVMTSSWLSKSRIFSICSRSPIFSQSSCTISTRRAPAAVEAVIAPYEAALKLMAVLVAAVVSIWPIDCRHKNYLSHKTY